MIPDTSCAMIDWAGLRAAGNPMIANWFSLAFETALLAVEAQRVVGLRLVKIAAGGAAAQAEIARMLTEKPAAAAEAALTVATGGSARKVMKRYRSRVRANAKRLQRGRARLRFAASKRS